MEDFGYSKKEKHEDSLGMAKKVFLIAASLFSITCFIYVTINAYNFFYSNDSKNVETITSPESPIKVIEEEKTNENNKEIEINRSVYEDIFGNRKESLKKITPKLKTAIEPAQPPKSNDLVKEKIVSPNTVDKKTSEETSQNQSKDLVYSTTKKEEQHNDVLEKKSAAAKEKKVSDKKSKTKQSANNAIRVQIAAMTSQKAAEDYWEKLNRVDSKIFSSLDPYIEEVDLGKRGIFYRLQIGNFFNQVDADNFCNKYITKMHKTRADCIVVE